MVPPKVLCSLTTYSPKGFSWQSKIEEIRELRLPEFALFLTGLKGNQRYALYEELLKLKREYQFEIPFVHATSEMSEDDYFFLSDNFSTKVFNLHPVRDCPLVFPLSPSVRSKIFIENATRGCGKLFESDLEGFAGICFDLSHCEDEIFKDPIAYYNYSKLISKAKVGANHFSSIPPIGKKSLIRKAISEHFFSSLDGFEYIRGYGPEFFGEYGAIEIEDPIFIQIEVKKYIDLLLSRYVFVERELKVA